jgi:hypothetical protein
LSLQVTKEEAHTTCQRMMSCSEWCPSRQSVPAINFVIKLLIYKLHNIYKGTGKFWHWLAPLRVPSSNPDPGTLYELHPSCMSFGWDIKFSVPCISVYAGQVKRFHMWVNM